MSLTYAQKVQHCEAALDHIFQNKLLILEALHMTVDHILWQEQMHAIGKNERLAILGNNIMRAYFCNQWFETGRVKASWSTAEQALFQAASLARVGFEQGLNTCVIASTNQNVTTNMMATTVQALIGAIYIEGGEQGMAKLLTKLGLTHEYLRSPE